MLNVKCPGCGAIYKLSEDLYSRKAEGFGVVVTCRRCKSEIHVETMGPDAAPTANGAVNAAPAVGSVPDAEQATVATDDSVTAATDTTTKQDTAAKKDAETRTSPVAPAVAPRAESPSPPPAAAVDAGRPRRPPAPPGSKLLAKRDPVSGPFVALSPGLLGGGRIEPGPDSELPVDSSDFINEPKGGASPKAPPVRRSAETEQKTEKKLPPVRQPTLPLKLKEPPKPPKQKPKAPVRSDDVSDDLLSADVGFEGAPPLEAEPPRLVAPTSSALAAPPPEPEPEPEPEKAKDKAKDKKSPKAGAATAAPAKSDAREQPKGTAKSSSLIPIALVSLGAAGAFALAFGSQQKVPEPPAAPPEPAALAPTVSVPAPSPEATNVPVPPTPATSATVPSAPGVAPRVGAAPAPTSATAPAPPSGASAGPKPAVTAPASGTPEPTAPPPSKPEGPFNAEAARTALAGAVAQASSCRKPGDPSGVAAVTITFSPSGRVTSATIAGPPFAGTPTGGCIAATLRRARVPAFTGDMVTVRKTVEIR